MQLKQLCAYFNLTLYHSMCNATLQLFRVTKFVENWAKAYTQVMALQVGSITLASVKHDLHVLTFRSFILLFLCFKHSLSMHFIPSFAAEKSVGRHRRKRGEVDFRGLLFLVRHVPVAARSKGKQVNMCVCSCMCACTTCSSGCTQQW
jgi:hypothetical protein